MEEFGVRRGGRLGVFKVCGKGLGVVGWVLKWMRSEGEVWSGVGKWVNRGWVRVEVGE